MEDNERKTESPAQNSCQKNEEDEQVNIGKTIEEPQKENLKKNSSRTKRNSIEKTLDDSLKGIQNLLKVDVIFIFLTFKLNFYF